MYERFRFKKNKPYREYTNICTRRSNEIIRKDFKIEGNEYKNRRQASAVSKKIKKMYCTYVQRRREIEEREKERYENEREYKKRCNRNEKEE